MSELTPWDHYSARVQARGGNDRRAVSLKREARHLNMKMPWSLSYHHAVIDGEERQLAIINSDNLDQKMLMSLPGEDLRHGADVEWMDNHWLIIEKDANNELYTRAKMRQCNYLLKWLDEDKVLQERWVIVEDGTKYLVGEYGDRDFIMNRGDTRVYMTIARDSDTIKLSRKSRFLIDDYESPTVLAYRLTKPLKMGSIYNGNGVMTFILVECNTEDDDNIPEHIADYYSVFPDEAVCVNYPDCQTRLPLLDDQGWTVVDGQMYKPNGDFDPDQPELYDPENRSDEDGTVGKKVWL